MDLCRQASYKMSQLRRAGRTRWHHARFVDHRNVTRVVRPGSPAGDQVAIQAAIDAVAGTYTAEYQRYLQAHREWAAKWYRLLVRQPYWINGGAVKLSAGAFRITEPIRLYSGTQLTGDGSGTTL